MEIRYTIKIRDEHNPPEFKKGMGKGVLVIEEAVYKTIKTEEDLKSIQFKNHVVQFSMELLEKWFEVIPEVIDVKKERKEKLKKLNGDQQGR